MTPEQAYSFLSSQSTPTSQAPKTPLAAYAFLAGEPVVDADNPPTLSPELLAAYQTDQAEKSAQQPGKAVQFLFDMATAPGKVRDTISAVALGAVGHLVDGAETLISGAYRGTETGLALKQALGDESETPYFEAGKAIIEHAKSLQPVEWQRMLRNYDVNQAQFNAEQKRLESQGEFEGFWGGAKKIGNEALHTLGNVAENPAVIGRTLETSLAPLAIGAFNPWAGAAAGAAMASSEVLKNNQQFLETIPQYELDQSPYYNEIKSRLGLSDGEARYYIANNLAENGWNMATAAGVEFFLERFALGKLFKPSKGAAWKSALSKGAVEAGTELPQELTQTYVGNDAVIDTADRLNIHTDRKHTDGMGEAAVLAPLSGFAVGSAIGGITTAPSPRERFNNDVDNEQSEASENNAQPVVQPLDENALNQVAKQFEPTLGDEATALKAELKSDIENGNLAEAMQSQDRDYAAIARAYAQAVGFEAQNALPAENAPSDDNLFTQIKQKIVDFVGRVRADKTLREQVELMPVSDIAVQEAAEHGLDIAGFTHLIDSSAINHIFKQHGNEKSEKARGQIAVTDTDFANITDIITAPDMVVYGGKTKIGRDGIFYIKKAEDGSTLVVEEVRQGKKKLALTSMRKYPPTTRANSILNSLGLNVQNDFGGSGLSIVQNPKNRNKPSTIVRDISGYKQKSADGQRVGFDTTEPTHSKPTLARQGMGAAEMSLANTPGVETVSELDGNKVSLGENQEMNQSRGATTSDLRSTDPIRSRIDEVALGSNNVRPTTQDVNSSPEIQQAKAILEKALGKAYADQVNFVRSSDFNDGRATAEGFYLNGKVHIVVDNIHGNNTMNRAERMAWVAWHEFAHNGVDVRFKGNYDEVIETARSHPVVNVISRRIKAEYETAVANGELNKMPNENTLVEEALVELYAAAKTGNWAEIESRYNTRVHRSWKASDSSLMALFERIANAMRRMVGRIIGKDLRQASNDEVFAILKGIDQGVQSLAENSENQTASGDARYSLNERADSAFAKAVDDVFNSDNRSIREEWIDLGTTPKPLIEAGIDDLPMFMNKQKIGKIKNEHPEMTADLLKQIPKQLNNPVAIFKNTKGKPNSYVILTELNVKNGELIIAALHANETTNGLEFHKLASAYGKDGTAAYLGNMIEKSDVRFVDKQKVRELQDTLQLLAPETLNALFDNASVVKNADESNSKFSRAARRPSVLDQIQNGEVNRENSALWQDLKQGNLKNIYRRAEDFVQQQMQDETLPVDKWAQATFDPVIARNLISAKDRAQNIRMDLNGRVSQKYITPLFKNISDLAKKYDLDLEFAQHITQYWYSARYSIEKNQEILDREKQAWTEAQQALADAQQKGDPDEISRAARAERRAKKQYNDRLHDANLTDWTKDANGEYIVKRRVGTAGGWSFAHAKAIMTAAERYIPAQDIEQAMMPLKEAVRWNIWENFRVGRITDAQKTEYLRKPNYVPLTGDPYSVLDTANSEDDFIGGAGGKNVNTSRDHTMDGRRESEADGAVDAIMGMLDKTNANSAWSEFKNIIDDVYETAYQTHIANGMTQVEARKEAQRETGISKQRLQGGTRTNDKVLIRKMGGVSYEYRLPDSVINALQKSTQETDGAQAWAFVTAPFKTLTSWLARGVTQFNPAFALTNFISDIQDKATLIIAEDVFVNGRKLSGGEMTKISGAVLKNAALSFKATGKFGFKGTEGLNMNNKMERNLKRLIELGGISNYSTYLAKTKESLRDEIKRIHKPHLKSLDGALKTVAAYNATFDYVSSLATYTALTDAGVDEKQAATVTLNLMNFRKQGEFAKYLKPFYMFINPAIQGNAKTLRLLKTNRGRAVFAVNVVKSMALYAFIAALADDDELGNTLMSNPFYPREIQIPLFGNGTLRIPLGFGVQQLSWVVGANIVKAGSGQISYGEAVGNILGASTKAVAPIAPSEISPTKSPLGWLVNTFSPQLLKPFLQLWSNRNSFGSPIVSEGGNSKLPKALQGKTETAETWKTLAQDIYDITGLDTQPEVYKHLFDSHQGMLGAFGQYLSNQIENPALEMRGKRERTLILDRFYRDLGNNKVQNYYYQAKEEAEDLLKEMEYAKESGKLAEWRTPEKIARIRWYKQGEEKLRELYQQKSALEKQRRADRIRGTNRLSDERFSERVKLINSRIEKVQRQQIHEWRKMEGLRTTLPK